jgi:putative flippase GtrA
MKWTFLKAQASSLVSTAVDFTVAILLVEVVGLWYMPATITGTISGGITNFLLGRQWVFGNGQQPVPRQAIRYMVVWTGSMLLNAGGVYLITHYTGTSYIISKVIASVIVGFSFNYLLQKKYVFQ